MTTSFAWYYCVTFTSMVKLLLGQSKWPDIKMCCCFLKLNLNKKWNYVTGSIFCSTSIYTSQCHSQMKNISFQNVCLNRCMFMPLSHFHMCACMHKHTLTHTHTYELMYSHMHACMHAHMHTHTHTHTHTHAHTHTHTHTLLSIKHTEYYIHKSNTHKTPSKCKTPLFAARPWKHLYLDASHGSNGARNPLRHELRFIRELLRRGFEQGVDLGQSLWCLKAEVLQHVGQIFWKRHHTIHSKTGQPEHGGALSSV